LAGILRYGFPSPSALVERGGGARESGNAGGCPPLQQVRKKNVSSVAVPPHFPEEFGGPHRRERERSREGETVVLVPP